MASSSSSWISSEITYDVFISFRWKDVGNTFCSHLCAALDRKKIKTFSATEEQEKEDEISSSISRTIQASKIALVIFSENYAFSKRCLDELAEIFECKKRTEVPIVMPVFHYVDPSDVRKQSGGFATAFSDHERNYLKSKVETWRIVLTRAGNLSGWDSSRIRPDSVLVEKIVQDIFERLKLSSSSVFEKRLVGIHSRLEKVMSLLNIGDMQDFGMVGIWGMGGIGKTTIANAIYNQISGHFEGRCFLNNVRESAIKGDLVHLRKKLFSKLLGEPVSAEGTPTIGSSFIRHRLQDKRVLVVLDNVSDPQQINFLFGGIDHLGGPGSRVIITTRDRQVLNYLDVKAIYKVERLDFDEGLNLFGQHAFKDHPSEDYLKLSGMIVRYAKGVPLALKVLGSSLRSQNKKYWEGILKKLNNIPNPRLIDVLKISYEGLDCEVKEIFLDIAFFLKGDDIDVITRLLDDEYLSLDYGIDILVDRSLISITNSRRIKMHDSLQEMGWDIGRDESKNPKKRKRLCYPEDVFNLLTENQGSESIRGISLEWFGMKKLSLNPDAFAKMPNMKFLKINGYTLKIPYGLESLPNELGYLSWSGYSVGSLPSTFCAERLVKLEMPDSTVEKLWNGKQNLVSLQHIDLRYSKNLKDIPDLSCAMNLETMYLDHCETLVEIPSFIKHLLKLSLLDLSECKNLRQLPNDICKLKSLEFLSLSGCSQLETFPDIFETMENLEVLDLNGSAITELPPSIEFLVGLLELRLDDCKNLSKLPDNLWRLTSLYCLEISKPNPMTFSFPKFPSLLDFCNLLYLRLNDLSISEIPVDISCLSSIEQLELCGNNLETIPASIKQLGNLKQLFLSHCKRLQSLPELPAKIERLAVDHCGSLKISNDKPFFNARLTGRYTFIDSFELDQQVIIQHVGREYNKLLEQQDIKDVEGKFCICIPGNEVPNGFQYQNKACSSIIIDPGSSELLSIVLCFVIASDCSGDPNDFDFFEIVYSKTKPLVSCTQYKSAFGSDHILLLYLKETCDSIREKLSKETSSNDAMILEFGIHPLHSTIMNMKSCGVHVLKGNPSISFGFD